MNDINDFKMKYLKNVYNLFINDYKNNFDTLKDKINLDKLDNRIQKIIDSEINDSKIKDIKSKCYFKSILKEHLIINDFKKSYDMYQIYINNKFKI